MNLYTVLKFIHVLAALLLATGSIGSLLLAIRARRATSVAETATLMRAHHFTVTCGIIPGAVGSLLTGAWLVSVLSVPYSALWVVGSFIGWAASFAIGVGLLVPAEKRAIAEADRLSATGTAAISPALAKAVGAPIVWMGEWATALLIVAMVALMIFKPY